jgi:hypothetical protein
MKERKRKKATKIENNENRNGGWRGVISIIEAENIEMDMKASAKEREERKAKRKCDPSIETRRSINTMKNKWRKAKAEISAMKESEEKWRRKWRNQWLVSNRRKWRISGSSEASSSAKQKIIGGGEEAAISTRRKCRH